MNVEEAQSMLSEKGSWIDTLVYKLSQAAHANPKRRFGLLYVHVCNPFTLIRAWQYVKANRGSSGVDHVTIEEVTKSGETQFLEEIRQELLKGTYKAEKIRRVYIPKTLTSKRPLGIPTLKDRVVQMAVKLVIEYLFEADFCPCSYGFRPGIGAAKAVQAVHRTVNEKKWVVDVDLKSYFDTIDHDLLMNLVRRRVSDPKILNMIRQWLKAGILEKGQTEYRKQGTPQGGVLSPLLSNIFLHEIDKQWVNNPSVSLIRYADDMVILCRSQRQAYTVRSILTVQLNALHLVLNKEKTKVVHVKDSFDFLGFTFVEKYSKKQKCMVRIKYPRAKSMQKCRDNLKKTCKSFQLGTCLEEVIGKINQKIQGWVNYFKIGNSYKQVKEINDFACQQLRLFLRRRTKQKYTQCYRRWPNNYFYRKGLVYAPGLL